LWAASALSNFWPSAKLVVASFLIIGIFVFRSRTFSILLIAALVGITIVSFRQSALHNQLIISKINSTVLISGLVRSDPQLKPGQVVGSYRKPDQSWLNQKSIKLQHLVLQLVIFRSSLNRENFLDIPV